MSQVKSRNNQSRRSARTQNGKNKPDRGNVHAKNQQSQNDNAPKHQEIIDALADSKHIDLDDYKDVLLETDMYGWSLLHRIILYLKAADKKQYQPASEEILTLVERLVIDKPKLLTQKMVNESFPLLDASNFKLEIVFRVINLVAPDAVIASLETPCSEQDQKCPLESVSKVLRERCRPDESKMPSAATNQDKRDEDDERKQNAHMEIITTKSDNATGVGNESRRICLHGKINVRKLREKNEDIKKELSNGLARQKKSHGTCLQSLIIANNFRPKRLSERMGAYNSSAKLPAAAPAFPQQHF